MSSGHAWCQVVKILGGYTLTRHLSGRGRGSRGVECRAPEFSAWLVDSQSRWGWLGLGLGRVWEAGEQKCSPHCCAEGQPHPYLGFRPVVEAEPQPLPTCF